MKCFRHVCYWFNCENNRKKTVDNAQIEKQPSYTFQFKWY